MQIDNGIYLHSSISDGKEIWIVTSLSSHKTVAKGSTPQEAIYEYGNTIQNEKTTE